MAAPFVFHRPELAARMVDMTLGRDILAGDSGLFLAAPRRTGKSTFLKRDLVPAFEAAGVTPVYIDLWSDRARDPARVILEGLVRAVQERDPALAKAVRRSGLSKVSLGSWLSLDLAQGAGTPGSMTFTDVVRELLDRTGRPVVLVVDEAQHATTTDAGRNAMFALKSARDVLNGEAKETAWGNVNLGLVFTGSNRDKLASLMMGRSQPFFGSSITPFPLLGRDYVDAFVGHVNTGLSEGHRLVVEETLEAFEAVGSRPQLLLAAVNAYVVGRIGEAGPGRSLMEGARLVQEAQWTEFELHWAALTPLQRAVLGRLVDRGSGFKPFDAAALDAYGRAVGGPVTPSEAQSALDALREKGVVVRLERGLYTLEDGSMPDWFAARRAAGDGDEGVGGPG